MKKMVMAVVMVLVIILAISCSSAPAKKTVADIRVDSTAQTVKAGKSVELTAVAVTKDGQETGDEISWTLSKESEKYGKLSTAQGQKVKLTGKAAGKVKVTAKTGTVEKSVEIKVTK